MLEKAAEGGWVIYCDACPDVEEMPDASGFEDALAKAKAMGWKPVHVKSAWEHRCPSCLEEESKP